MAGKMTKKGATFSYHLDPKSLLEYAKKAGARMQLVCPDEDAVEAGRTVYWTEEMEVLDMETLDDAKGKGKAFPLNTRKKFNVKFQVAQDAHWYDNKGEDLGPSENAGRALTMFTLMQELGEDEKQNKMVEITQQKLSSLLVSAGGITEDNLDEVPLDPDGNVDFTTLFLEKKLVGQMVKVLLKKYSDEYEDEKGHKQSSVKVEPVSFLPQEEGA